MTTPLEPERKCHTSDHSEETLVQEIWRLDWERGARKAGAHVTFYGQKRRAYVRLCIAMLTPSLSVSVWQPNEWRWVELFEWGDFESALPPTVDGRVVTGCFPPQSVIARDRERALALAEDLLEPDWFRTKS